MWDIALSTLAGICTLGLGYLGLRLTLHPPQSDHERGIYKVVFIALGIISVGIIGWQAVRTNIAQEEFKKSQSQLEIMIQDEKKATQVAHEELKSLRGQTDKLRADLAVESARRDQAQKDMALIIKKAGTETRVGVAEDFRKSPIKVDIPIGKEPVKLYVNRSQPTRGENVPYETQFLITVNQAVTPVRLLVQCVDEIVDGHGSLIGVGASMSGGWGGRFSKNAIGIGILSPVWTPANPMLVTIKSNTNPLGVCRFDRQ